MSDNSLVRQWDLFFKKVDGAKILYVKSKCSICAERTIQHYTECTHIDIDLTNMRKYVNRRLKEEGKKMLGNHLELINA